LTGFAFALGAGTLRFAVRTCTAFASASTTSSVRSTTRRDKRSDRGPGSWGAARADRLRLPGLSALQRAPTTDRKACRRGGQSPRGTWGGVGLPRACACGKAANSTTTRELLQGFGVANTQGGRRFPQRRSPARPFPTRSTARRACFVAPRHRAGRRGAKKVDSDFGQLAGKARRCRGSRSRPAGMPSRISSTTNSYAQRSPGSISSNWSIWAAGRLRLCRRQRRIHLGASAGELNQPKLVGEAGLLPRAGPDRYQCVRSRLVLARGGYGRRGWSCASSLTTGPVRCGSAPGLNSSFAGGYNDAVGARCRQSRALSANDTIPLTRPGPHEVRLLSQPRAGRLSDNVGAFARLSWNDGRTEIMSFTDIDSSISAGLSIKGQRPWGRPSDTIGIAGRA